MAARILGRKNKAKSANADRAQVIEFKTGDRIVTLDLLQLLRARIAEGSLGDDAASAESPRAIREVIQRTIRVEPAAAEETH
jgi:hypothetical protein